MHRRQFLAGCGAVLVAPAMADMVCAQGTPEASPMADSGQALDQAAVMFTWPDEDGIRSVMARVSQWPDPESASAFHDLVLQSGGSNLPNGEFYQSDVEPYWLDMFPEGVSAGMVGWTTTVGVAAFQTGFALLSLREDAMLWDVVITASSEDEAVALGEDLAYRLFEIVPPPCSSLSGYLPTLDDMPSGASAEDYTYTRRDPEEPGEHALNLPEVPLPQPSDGSCGDPA